MKAFYKFFAISILFIFCSYNATNLFAQSTPDPGLPGSYAVSKDYYNLGDLAYTCPTSFPSAVEVCGSVFYPTSLSGGPFPVLFFMHGRHSTVYQTSNPSNTNLAWPPATGWQSITSYEGYDTLARLMASQGFIVISISVNAINAVDNSTADRGMQARGEILQHHMDLWNTYNTVGAAPFGTRFVGQLDMNNIGTMGHSRGGEGVVYNALYNRSLGSPYGIKAVLTLAPVDFNRRILNDIPLMNIAPYCDGDVTSIAGVHFYDDARYNVSSDSSEKYSVLMMGANHNFYNTVWTPGAYIAGTSDDWDNNYGSGATYCGSSSASSKRLSPAKQRAALNTYAAAFFRKHLTNDTIFNPILEVVDIIPPVSSRLDTASVFVSYHPSFRERLDVNRVDTSIRITTNSLADSVSQNGLLIATVCGGGLSMTSCGISTFTAKEPHKGSTTARGLAQMNMKWDNTTDWYRNKIPTTYQNISGYGYIQYRAAVNYAEYTTAVNLDYSIQLIDSLGNISSVKASKYTKAMFLSPGTTSGILPKIMFNTIRIPLNAFSGILLTKVKYVKFLFDQSSAGAILISDLSFSGQASNMCANVSANFSIDTSGGYLVHFRDTSLSNASDTRSWQWNFGDPSSGVSNTASTAFPNHMYTGPGTFSTCLYLSTLTSTGITCRDTICKNVLVADECNYVDAIYTNDTIGGYEVQFNDSSTQYPSQVLSWQWNFGDAASGIANTSTLESPIHTYTNMGTFQTCLYISALQINGTYCYDTICKNIFIADECSILHAGFTADSSNIFEMTFTNSTTTNSSDVVSWSWDFGDTAVAANDTSSLQNPIYTYSGPGTYTVCLYVKTHTARGFDCTDTICSNIIVKAKEQNTNSIVDNAFGAISIYPNPASDYLYISGLTSNAKITIYTTLGSLVLSSVVNQHQVALPASLTNDTYFVELEINNSKIYKRIVIVR